MNIKKLNIIIFSVLLYFLIISCHSGATSDNKMGIKTDTTKEVTDLKLTYMAYACYCPDWEGTDVSKDSINRGYYLLPLLSSRKIPDSLMVAHNRFKISGYLLKHSGIPADYGYNSPDVKPGRIIYYTNYVLIH